MCSVALVRCPNGAPAPFLLMRKTRRALLPIHSNYPASLFACSLLFYYTDSCIQDYSFVWHRRLSGTGFLSLGSNPANPPLPALNSTPNTEASPATADATGNPVSRRFSSLMRRSTGGSLGAGPERDLLGNSAPQDGRVRTGSQSRGMGRSFVLLAI